MSLTHRKTSEVVRQQFWFKLKSNVAVFTVLFALQILLSVLMTGPSSTSGMGSANLELNWSTYTNDGIITMTLFWSLAIGFLMTTSGQRNASYLYVASPGIENMANFLFFGAASVIAGVTAILSGSIMKVILLLTKKEQFVSDSANLLVSPVDFFTQLAAMISYSFLLMILVYTAMLFVQMNRLLILPIILLVYLNTRITSFEFFGATGNILSFFYGESSLWLFTIKVTAAVALLMVLSVIPSKRIEVRQA
ncbi:hypothetical protein [Sporosarcina aquimarina]|uniref:ABC transporter permease n=1 Tax=Sporosarcina aquimarina TaxID=114975 RepID=A0ABU4FUU8_9BACL|nr:hypothetical protein [Sporosarcina aquimarina]MDW0108495.1 hypothetical protein [Sporosarcina aquimarina]